MDPKRHYPPEAPAVEPRTKPKAVAPSITDNVHYAAAAKILRTLENGFTAVEAEADALRIEDHLGRQPDDRKKPRPHARNALLQARLNKHRAATPAEEDPDSATGKLPVAVTTALEIIRGSRPVTRVDRRTLIAQLEADATAIRAAIFVQQAIVDELRNELSCDIAKRLMKDHRKLVLAIFRAAQAFALASDSEAEFRRSVVDAGYTWRPDLLQGPQLRAALVLGSESTFDSDISRARRVLEELGFL